MSLESMETGEVALQAVSLAFDDASAAPTRYVFWLLLNLLAAMLVHLSSLPIPCNRVSANSCWRTWLVFETAPDGSTYFQAPSARMTPFQRVYDWLQCVFFVAVCLFWF